MKEWEQEVLGQYDIDVKNMKKVRSGILCECEEGLYLLKEAKLSDARLGMLENVGIQLREAGFEETDYLIRNTKEELASELEDGSKYILKKWFAGKECDVKREHDLLSATKNLARLHKALEACEVKSYCGEDMQQVYSRHNREMKKTRSFIRKKVEKGKFEDSYLKYFDVMYDWAEGALAQLSESDYKKIPKKLIHGDYNYHNIIISQDYVATTSFERFEENIQITDLYYFLRKTMEKYDWEMRLGEKILNYYQRFANISKEEMEYLGILMAYPEKFWKAANAYSRANKAWIPAKSLEKLELVTKQLESKARFLDNVLGFRL